MKNYTSTKPSPKKKKASTQDQNLCDEVFFFLRTICDEVSLNNIHKLSYKLSCNKLEKIFLQIFETKLYPPKIEKIKIKNKKCMRRILLIKD